MMASIGLLPYVGSQASQRPGPCQPADASDSAARERSKLVKAAGDFEAMLMNTLWQSMKGTFSGDNDESEDDPILKSFDDWGTQSLSQAAGSAGAFGIKSLILKNLSPLIGSASQGEGEHAGRI
jgi:Rod binding domain-containing protein